MATRKTTSEQIAETESRIKQYENRMKLLLQKQKTQERKERTHRLIERGAILESLIDKADTLTNEQIKMFLEMTVQTADAKVILKELLPPPEKPQDGSDAVPQDAPAVAPSPVTVAQGGGTAATPKPTVTPQSGGSGTVQTTGNNARTTG